MLTTKEKQIWEQILGKELVDIRLHQAGRNSRIYILRVMDGRKLVGKHYFSHPNANRDRMGKELAAYRLMSEHGFSRISKVVEMAEELGRVIFSLVEGSRPRRITPDEIEQMLEFCRWLRQLSTLGKGEALGPASEACFSAQAVMENLQQRLKRLPQVESGRQMEKELQDFLKKGLQPAIDVAKSHCESVLTKAGLALQQELEPDLRCLSPSDFGFHNTLDDKGTLYFFDFEHFGWDDPAKTLCDFLLHPHPAMAIGRDMRLGFLKGFLQIHKEEQLSVRVRGCFALFACKWALILLNEFVDAERQRRDFAGGDRKGLELRLKKQLIAAQIMVSQMWSRYERYCGHLA